MAFVEIPEQPFKKFLKIKEVFARIGDSFDGVYVSDEPNEKFNDGTQDFIFSVDGCPAVSLGVKGTLKGQLEKAKRDGQLKPGSRVLIKFVKEIPTDKGNPMRSFKVGVDPDYKGHPPKNGANVDLSSRKPAGSGSGEEAPF
jgi:hypothetical protein